MVLVRGRRWRDERVVHVRRGGAFLHRRALLSVADPPVGGGIVGRIQHLVGHGRLLTARRHVTRSALAICRGGHGLGSAFVVSTVVLRGHRKPASLRFRVDEFTADRSCRDTTRSSPPPACRQAFPGSAARRRRTAFGRCAVIVRNRPYVLLIILGHAPASLCFWCVASTNRNTYVPGGSVTPGSSTGALNVNSVLCNRSVPEPMRV